MRTIEIKGKKYAVREKSIAGVIVKIKDALKPKTSEDVKMHYLFTGAMLMLAFLAIGEIGFRAMGM